MKESSSRTANIYIDQLLAGIIQGVINEQKALKAKCLAEIQQETFEKMQSAYTALNGALKHIENVRDFASSPEHILGSMATKHGEIAEHIEVEIRNARDIINHLTPNATFDGVGRTAPEDYLINGVSVQSKFINGADHTLSHVLKHMSKYKDFADSGYYHIPKDQFELIRKVYDGDSSVELSDRAISKIKKLIEEVETTTGKDFFKVVYPGESTYKEVQLGNLDETLQTREQEIKDINALETKTIRQDADIKKESAQHITDASLGEAVKYSAISAAIAGGVAAGLKVYSKLKNGQKITEFTLEDWKDVGYDFAKNGAKSGISGLTIYGLTKIGHLSAPFAGATASTMVGIASLAYSYQKGEMSYAEFTDSACALSVEAGLASIGAAIGQTVIPIPVLGAIIGSATAKVLLEISKRYFGSKEKQLIRKMQQEYDTLINTLNEEAKKVIAEIDAYFAKLGGLIEAALSKEAAVAFYGSVDLCRFLNINEDMVIHNKQELDVFMSN